MIWLALPLTVWACVAAYAVWAWRAICLATIAEKRAEQERTEKAFERIQALIKQSSAVREQAPPAPFPPEGDNFTTLGDASIVRPEFGKKPRATDTPDGVS